ncbi:solute carrier family 25 member 35-like [Galendromus occidentalis]|uniref:Solute carrier family 25 member 35-like n=1 Tax=Galendromus occidentalis TaxID=34638 RepID=A0AAJ6QX15_9ACAR|nr:solute carrier family 25 member 35-like [Galendromus occidentalis]
MADIIIGSSASIVATVVVHPIDVAKVLIQMQGELKRRGQYMVYYRSVPHAVIQVAKYDGIRAVYRGIIPATFYQLTSQGLRLGLFQTIEERGLTLDEDMEASVPLSALSGAFCGAVSSFVASPLFMVKNYMMIRSSSEIAVGHQRNYSSMLHALKDIYSTHRLRTGLWRGTVSNMLRTAVGSSLQLSTFVGMKNVLFMSVDYNERFMLINTLLAALVSSLITSPIVASLDLIRARIYIQPLKENGRGQYYKGIWDCAKQIRANEGFAGFWKGSTGAFMYVLLTSMITLVSWDELKHVRHERLNSRDYVIDFGYQ